MTYLLDVNVLIALIDPSHVAHDAAHLWFQSVRSAPWATCALTENGVIRIIGNPKYPNSPGSPAAVASIMRGLRSLPGHVFWSDDISIVASPYVDPEKLATSAQVTDSYLLALAVAHRGKLVTLDRRLSVTAVPNGKAALHIIGNTQN